MSDMSIEWYRAHRQEIASAASEVSELAKRRSEELKAGAVSDLGTADDYQADALYLQYLAEGMDPEEAEHKAMAEMRRLRTRELKYEPDQIDRRTVADEAIGDTSHFRPIRPTEPLPDPEQFLEMIGNRGYIRYFSEFEWRCLALMYGLLMPQKEIAAYLNSTEKAVRTAIYRAHKRIAEKVPLQQECKRREYQFRPDKPWEKMGISFSWWYRLGKPEPGSHPGRTRPSRKDEPWKQMGMSRSMWYKLGKPSVDSGITVKRYRNRKGENTTLEPVAPIETRSEPLTKAMIKPEQSENCNAESIEIRNAGEVPRLSHSRSEEIAIVTTETRLKPLVEHYLERALKAEDLLAAAKAEGKIADVSLLERVSEYCLAQAEAALAMQTHGDDLHALDRRFLASVTGKPDLIEEGPWNHLHSFLLTSALATLSETQFKVAVMRFVEGLSEKSIAARLGMRASTVVDILEQIQATWRQLTTGKSSDHRRRGTTLAQPRARARLAHTM